MTRSFGPIAVFRRLLYLYGRSVEVLDRVMMAACASMLVLVVAVNGIQVVTRSFFGRSSVYNAEVSLVISALMYFAGYLVLLKRREDVALEYFYLKLPPMARRLLDLLIAAAIVAFFTVLLAASLRYVRLTDMMEDPILPVPQSYTTAPILVAAVACLWVAVYQLLQAIERLAGAGGAT